MGGYPGLFLDADLDTNWQKILEENGLTVQLDENEDKSFMAEAIPTRIIDKPGMIKDEDTCLKILHATFLDREERNIGLGFFVTTKAERKLFLRVKEILIEAGATE